MKLQLQLALAGAGVTTAILTACHADRSVAPPAASSSFELPAVSTSDRPDPAAVRLALLSRMDAQIDAAATKSRLDARLMLNSVMPLPYLGVDSEPGPRGLVITAVYADTGAEECGLAKGDVLVAVDGARMEAKAALARTVRRHQVGDVVALTIEREGATKTLQATIGERPEEDEDDTEQFPDLAVPAPSPPAPLSFTFDADRVGALPKSFTSVLGGHGKPGAWIAVESERGLALRQDDPDKTGMRFPMAIVSDWRAKDAVVRVRFRYAGGRVDRAAGIVLRYRDPGNYLVARANALEADLRIFRVVNGDRRTLPGAIVEGATDDERWHTLEFRAVGAELTAVLDDTARATAVDTFFQEGGVGLWTKADSRTEFDDLRIEATR